MAKLLAGSFPPGSSIPYIEAVLGQGKQIDETEKKTNGNTQSIEELNGTVADLRTDLDANVLATQAAQQAADAAQGTADTAIANAEAAQNSADAAQGVAAQALLNAASAQSTADTAQEGVDDLQQHAIRDNTMAPQVVLSTFQALSFRVNGVQVVGAQVAGFTAPTGTQKKDGVAADTSYPVGAAYSQAEVQALATGLVEARQMIAALQALILAHGLGGA